MTLITIFLAIIAYLLWRIFRQREDEKKEAANAKFEAEWEEKQREKFKDYPHLYGKLEHQWLAVFASHAEKGIPLLKLAFMLYLEESVKIASMEADIVWGTIWGLSEELLEHLEKYHEGSTTEHEIAVVTYWQIAGEAVSQLIKENPEIERSKLQVEPYTNIQQIASLFPQRSNHPDQEISFVDENGEFPRESEGSPYIHEKLKALGL